MFINTKGLMNPVNYSGAEFVLLELYKHAISIVHARRSRTEYMGHRPFASIYDARDEIFYEKIDDEKIIRRKTPLLNFNKVEFEEGTVELNICLVNPDQFDSSLYDSRYGAGSAQNAINNLKNNLSFIHFTAARILVELYVKALDLNCNRENIEIYRIEARKIIEKIDKFNLDKLIFEKIDLGQGEAVVNINLSNPFEPKLLFDAEEDLRDQSSSPLRIRSFRDLTVSVPSSPFKFFKKRNSSDLSSLSLRTQGPIPGSPLLFGSQSARSSSPLTTSPGSPGSAEPYTPGGSSSTTPSGSAPATPITSRSATPVLGSLSALFPRMKIER